MLRLWRADEAQLKPILVDCPQGRYPHTDAEGFTIYVNSHFDTEEEAWERLLADSAAGICLAGDQVIAAEKALQAASVHSAEQCKRYKLLTDGYQRYKNKQGESDAENPA